MKVDESVCAMLL